MNNLFEYFYSSYKKYPNNHYVFSNKYWTYDEVYQYIKLMITKLTKEGVNVDDKIVLYMENSIEYIVSYFAILYMGATVVPVIVSSTLENINDIVDDCKPSLILTSNALISRIGKSEIAEKTPIIVIDVNGIKKAGYSGLQRQYFTGKLAMIIYTSGTTSKSKGVMLSHKNLIANTESILNYLVLNDSDSVLVTLPFSYSYGNSLLLTHTKVGGLLHLSKAGAFPQVVLSTLENGKLTGFSTIGSYLKILLKQNNFTTDSFRRLNYITLAGEQTSKSDLIKLHSINKELKIYVMYGQTEASARLTYLEPSMLNKKLGSIGKPIKNVILKIVNENGEEVNFGESGEIIVKGDNIMLGYLNKPKETEEVLKDGWLYTGDVAFQDPEGYTYVVGRKNDIIKHLGHRISPIEIENYINACENILESAVIDHSDSEGNVEIIAYVVLEDKQLKMCDVSKALRSSLPLYKIPSMYRIVDELPKTGNGKIKRSELRKHS